MSTTQPIMSSSNGTVHDSKRLAGKVALVTGAATGIGEAIVELFVEQGARVVAADVNAQAGYKLVERLSQPAKHDDGAHTVQPVSFVQLDVTSEEQWFKAVEQVKTTYGRLDVLVNSAGLFSSSLSVGETELADFERIQNVNVKGTFLGIKHGGNLIKETPFTPDGGSIINIASVASKVAVAQMVSYCTSKAAVQHLTKVTALDLARSTPPIRCTSICPIWVRTPMLQEVESRLGEIKDTEANPMRAVLQPRDVAYSALFLASAEARYITGTEIVIDGGYSAQ